MVVIRFVKQDVQNLDQWQDILDESSNLFDGQIEFFEEVPLFPV
jgi:hypothetical protein